MRKILIYGLPVFVMGLAVYLLIAYAATVLIYVGLAFYTLIAALFYVGAHKNAKLVLARSGPEQLAREAQTERKRQTFWGRLEVTLHQLAAKLQMISMALIWPFAALLSALIYMVAWRHVDVKTRAGATKVSMFPGELVAPLATALACALAVLLLLGGAPRKLVLFLVVLAAVSTLLRLVAITMGPISLPRALRIKSAHPYLLFIFIALLDGLSLLLSLHLSRGLLTAEVQLISLTGLQSTAQAVFDTPSFLRMVLPPRPMDWQALLLGIVGVIFFGALLNNLIRLKEFRRTDEDYIVLAHAENQFARFSKALRLLAHVSETQDYQAKLLPVRATALAGLNQFEAALKDMETLVSLNNKSGLQEFTAFPLICLSSAVSISGADIATKVKLVRFAVSRAPSSREVAIICDGMFGLVGGEVEAFAKALLADETLVQHPAALAMAMFWGRRREEALKLVSETSYNHPIDELHRKIFLVFIELANPDTSRAQDAEVFDLWMTEHIESLEAVVRSSDSISDALFLVGLLRTTLQVAEEFSHPAIERLRYMQDLIFQKVRVRVPESSEVLAFLKVLERENSG